MLPLLNGLHIDHNNPENGVIIFSMCHYRSLGYLCRVVDGHLCQIYIRGINHKGRGGGVFSLQAFYVYIKVSYILTPNLIYDSICTYQMPNQFCHQFLRTIWPFSPYLNLQCNIKGVALIFGERLSSHKGWNRSCPSSTNPLSSGTPMTRWWLLLKVNGLTCQ